METSVWGLLIWGPALLLLRLDGVRVGVIGCLLLGPLL